MKKHLTVAAILGVALLLALKVGAHCEIPCGIYDDQTRFKLLREHIDTIAKSISEIEELSKDTKPDYNQLVRWIANKDTHADEFQHIVSQYFMTQRIKPVPPEDPAYKDYVAKITVLHQMLIAAMKTKQSTDANTIWTLSNLTSQFEKLYFPEAAKEEKK